MSKKNNATIVDVQDNELEMLVNQLATLTILEKQIDEQVNELKQEVKTYMNDNNLTNIASGTHTCTIETCNLHQVDKEKVKAKSQKLYEFCLETSSYDRLTIK